MKIVQSFYSSKTGLINSNYNWKSPKFHWISWILSSNLLKKYHDSVTLYTDTGGKEILVDKMELPYDHVNLELDDMGDYNHQLWALGKIKTYQLQDSPFIHVDGDVFVWENLSKKFIDSDLVCQNFEFISAYYRNMWAQIKPHLQYVPDSLLDIEHDSSYSCNMGIFGGYNLEFIKHYCEKSFELVSRNRNVWNDINLFNFNIFFEQVLFKKMAVNSGITIARYFEKTPKDNEYVGFGNFDEVPVKKFLHLIGNYKRNTDICRLMEIYVIKYYPEEYARLLSHIEPFNPFLLKGYFVKEKLKFLHDSFQEYLYNGDFPCYIDYLFGRDLYNEAMPIWFDKAIEEDDEFYIKKLVGWEIKNDTLIIDELHGEKSFYQMDSFDDLLINNFTSKVIPFDKIIANIFNEVDKSNKEFVDKLLCLIIQRTRNYIKLKIISVISKNAFFRQSPPDILFNNKKSYSTSK